LKIWRNLDTQNSTNMRILRELRKELAEPLGSAEPRLKNTDVEAQNILKYKRDAENILVFNLFFISS